MQCSRGHQNRDGQNYCGECGETLPKPDATSEATEPPIPELHWHSKDPGSAASPPRRHVVNEEPPVDAVAAAWLADPSGRHTYRYWDGTKWTEHVSDGDRQTRTDVLDPRLPPPTTQDATPTPAAKSFVTRVKRRKKRWYRRAWVLVSTGIVLVAVIVAAFAASGSKTQPKTAETVAAAPHTTTGSPSTTPATTAATPTTTLARGTYRLGASAIFTNGVKITVYAYDQPIPANSSVFQPDPGTEYSAADVEYCATSTDGVSYNPFDWHAQSADNRQFSHQVDQREPALHSGDIPAGGGCVRGWVTLEAPIGARAAYVVFSDVRYAQTRWTT